MAHQHKIIELRSYLQRVIGGQQNYSTASSSVCSPAGRCGLKAAPRNTKRPRRCAVA